LAVAACKLRERRERQLLAAQFGQIVPVRGIDEALKAHPALG
jgi:hypothetical protein